MSQPNTLSRQYEIADSEYLVLLSDKASHFLYANPAYLRASGYEWSELQGKFTASMMHKDTPLQVQQDMVVTLKKREPWTGIIKNRRKNGDYYWLRLNISPLYSQGQYAGALLVHSKPSRQEIEFVEPLYRRMCVGDKSLTVRNGRPLVLTPWSRVTEYVRRFGLKAPIWGTMLALDAASLIALWLVAPVLTFKHAVAWLIFAGITSAAGLYLSRTIIQPLRQAVRYANEVAAADLGSKISSERSDEIGALMRGLAQMSMNVRAAVVDVRQGVDLMQRATADIASGTQDLSERTHDQAENLTRTVESMSQIGSTVARTSEASRNASASVRSASTAAEAGGKVIGEVVTTMAGITQSSKKIADIIGVIDSIAFQTNILALNAAVEAARAGEQGRGFAVVAGEVRSLAQRSAQSAREIRELILQSVQQVESGSKLVDSAGSTIAQIVAEVRRLSDLVSHIENGALEQSRGIDQVGSGISRIESMTQQNADLVEENTSSAESLRSQTARLSEAVSVFKLSEAENLAMFNATKLTSEDVQDKVMGMRAA